MPANDTPINFEQEVKNVYPLAICITDEEGDSMIFDSTEDDAESISYYENSPEAAWEAAYEDIQANQFDDQDDDFDEDSPEEEED